ncbi:uncharacterized protein MYCFIDRAFT_212216 [Pseudocercospora fijiensis CIRAD86]|uniref:Uncharacterized protein n=1 Tax=Pseudocercospora fijiensis (strain CIRAD86) TaxID=383855 RepID=M3A467_PSEFD|nr:uncharacterized protein MYCFIDRAFT_212216 [Pseudocercospora fijiensis CIRAD86]EME79416.1 hypothetical protein MYCFIDRAFT_212216 [Pseudocercospora fijiensis CIRAD86]
MLSAATATDTTRAHKSPGVRSPGAQYTGILRLAHKTSAPEQASLAALASGPDPDWQSVPVFTTVRAAVIATLSYVIHPASWPLRRSIYGSERRQDATVRPSSSAVLTACREKARRMSRVSMDCLITM